MDVSPTRFMIDLRRTYPVVRVEKGKERAATYERINAVKYSKMSITETSKV